MWENAAKLTLRFFFSALFLYTGALKLADPGGFAADIANYRMLPEALVGPLALALPVFELVIGVAFLLASHARGAALLSALLLTVFAVAMAQAKLRGIDLDCGCFGASEQSQVSWTKVTLDLVLAMLCLWLLWAQRPAGNAAAPVAASPAEPQTEA